MFGGGGIMGWVFFRVSAGCLFDSYARTNRTKHTGFGKFCSEMGANLHFTNVQFIVSYFGILLSTEALGFWDFS